MFVASSRAGTALGGVGMRDPRELIPELCMLVRPLGEAVSVWPPFEERLKFREVLKHRPGLQVVMKLINKLHQLQTQIAAVMFSVWELHQLWLLLFRK
jgi:hypothetical protein